MQVRIQLIRDDGSVVIDLSGPATAQLFWNADEPLRDIVVRPGVSIANFSYEPDVVTQFLGAGKAWNHGDEEGA